MTGKTGSDLIPRGRRFFRNPAHVNYILLKKFVSVFSAYSELLSGRASAWWRGWKCDDKLIIIIFNVPQYQRRHHKCVFSDASQVVWHIRNGKQYFGTSSNFTFANPYAGSTPIYASFLDVLRLENDDVCTVQYGGRAEMRWRFHLRD